MSTVDVTKTIDESRFTKFHLMVFLSCSFMIFFEGIDIGLLGVIAPSLLKEWSLTPVQFGSFGTYMAIGTIFGAVIWGPLGDKIGRRNISIACVLIYSLFTFVGGFSQGPVDFGIYRFLAGLGMGGIIPVALGIISDVSPKRIKSSIVATVTSFIGVGALFAALLGIFMIPAFGWRSLFWIGGIPILLLPLLYKGLPESPQLLVKKKHFEELTRLLNRMDLKREFHKEDQFVVEVAPAAKARLVTLFQNKRGIGTILIWFAFLCSYMVSYGMSAWLPNLMIKEGYPLGSSLAFVVILQLGALIGSVVGGRLADKTGLKKVTVICYLLGGLTIILLGAKFGSIALLYSILFIVGWGTTGSQNLAVAFCSQFYPSDLRSTGLGLATGIGKVGSSLGPLFGGVLLSLHASTAMCFIAFGILGLAAALGLFSVKESRVEGTPLIEAGTVIGTK